KLLTIRRRVMDSYLIQLYDSRGTLIFSEAGRGTQYIDVSSYSAGMYYLRTMDSKGSQSFQLSVQH
ncbi:MAG: T9SS type A sorting domain-containing protein, partial [Flavobacteriales bacterium]